MATVVAAVAVAHMMKELGGTQLRDGENETENEVKRRADERWEIAQVISVCCVMNTHCCCARKKSRDEAVSPFYYFK